MSLILHQRYVHGAVIVSIVLLTALQFQTITANNASNNATMISDVVTQLLTALKVQKAATHYSNLDNDMDLEPDNHEPELDKGRSTIRCLPHVIHLAVLALLTKCRAIRVSDVEQPLLSNITGSTTMTEDEAELIEPTLSESQLLANYNVANFNSLGSTSPFDKIK